MSWIIIFVMWFIDLKTAVLVYLSFELVILFLKTNN